MTAITGKQILIKFVNVGLLLLVFIAIGICNAWGEGGSWLKVADYNGECVLSGSAKDNYISGGGDGYKFEIIKGKYKLTQYTRVTKIFGQANDLKFCDDCPPPAPTAVKSCFDGFAQVTCEKNWQEGENCMIHPNQCSDMDYLGTYCMEHIKTLYEWGCSPKITGINPQQTSATAGMKIDAVTEPPGVSVKWSIKPDPEGKVHASITAEGQTATIYNVSGEGDMIIKVTSGECSEEFPIKIGCKACEGGNGGQCNDEAGSASEVGL